MPVSTPYNIAVTASSQAVSPLDVFKPEEWPDLIPKFGNQFMDKSGGYLMLRAMGAEYPVAQTEYSHFEEVRYLETLKILNTVASPGAGNSATYTLHPDSVDADNNYYVRLNQQVLYNNGVTGIVLAIDDITVPSAPTFTVRPNRAGDTIPTVTASSELVLSSNAFGDGTDQPVSIMPKVERFTNYTQIMKDTFGADGTLQSNQTWLDFQSQNNVPYTTLISPVMQYRINVAVDGALFHGKSTDNTGVNDPYNNRPIRTTTGLLPTVDERGYPIVRTPGTFSKSEVDMWDRIFDGESATNTMMMGAGLSMYQEFGDTFFNYNKDTGINLVKAAGDMFPDIDNMDTAQALATMLNFTAVNVSGRTYMMKKMQTWSDPKTYGATGYRYTNSAFIMPLGRTQTDYGSNVPGEMNKKSYENFCSRYKSVPGYNRYMKTWSIGGAKGTLTSVDLDNDYVRIDLGAQIMGANQIIYYKSNS